MAEQMASSTQVLIPVLDEFTEPLCEIVVDSEHLTKRLFTDVSKRPGFATRVAAERCPPCEGS